MIKKLKEDASLFDEERRVPVSVRMMVTLDPDQWAGEDDLQNALAVYLLGCAALGHVQIQSVDWVDPTS